MADDVLERLVVQLSADVKGYENALAKANNTTVRQLRAIEKQADSSVAFMEKRFGQFGVGLKDALIPGFAAVGAAIGEIIKSAVKDAADIGKLSDKLGEGTDQLQGLAYGAAQADVSFDDLGTGLLKFSKNLGEAANHNGDLYKTLKLNNVAITDATGKQRPFNDLLNDFADLVKNAKSEQEALALINIGFGKNGAPFLEFLRNGSGGLKEFQKDAKDAGGVIDENLIRRAQEFDDAWARAMFSIKAQTKSAVLEIIDEFTKPTNKLFSLSFNYKGPTLFGGDTSQTQSNLPLTPANQEGKGDLPPLGKPTKLIDSEADARAKKAAELAAQRAKAIKAVVDALALEYDNLGRSNVQQQIYNELQKAGVSANSEEGKAIIEQVQKIALKKQALETAAFAAEQLAEKEKAFFEGIEYLAETGGNAFIDLATGAATLDDALTNVLDTLVKAVLQAALLGQGPLSGLFGTTNLSGGTGGLFGSLLSFLNPQTITSLYNHTGGTAGTGGMSRRLPASLFANARRYHGGGIAGDEVPTILQRGEKIIPRGQSAGGSVVQIIDQRSNAPPIERQTTSNGGMRLLVRDQVNKTIAQGDADVSLGGRFGAKAIRTRRG